VFNGESIPMLQQRILDAGFENLNIIPMGADKVLLKASGIAEVNSILSAAAEFFNSFFSATIPWKKESVKFERGAWIRLYGIPLQAWNENFFRLCVFDFGRVMRVDLSTVDRERLDCARILIATSSLDIINSATDVLINEELVNIKIVEEWGFSIGEDVCVFEEESISDANDNVEENVNLVENIDGRDDNLVDNLVNDISKVFMEERTSCQNGSACNNNLVAASTPFQCVEINKSAAAACDMGVRHPLKAMVNKDVAFNATPSLCHASGNACKNKSVAASTPIHCVEINKSAAAENEYSIVNVDGSVHKGKDNIIGPIGVDGAVETRKPRIRTTSCPPSRERPRIVGPWSLEWLGDRNHGDAGVIFTSRKKLKKKSSINQGMQVKNKDGQVTKKKLDGVLRHPGGASKRLLGCSQRIER